MIKKILSRIAAAPLYGGFVLLFLLVASMVKHYTGFPEFLSQLAIFAIGVLLGCIAVFVGYRRDLKNAVSPKIANEIIPDARFWLLDFVREYDGARVYINGVWWLYLLPGNVATLHNAQTKQEHELGQIRTQKELDTKLQLLAK